MGGIVDLVTGGGGGDTRVDDSGLRAQEAAANAERARLRREEEARGRARRGGQSGRSQLRFGGSDEGVEPERRDTLG